MASTVVTDDRGLRMLRQSAGAAAEYATVVSRWSVGMHVHHCALAMIGMCNSVLESSPPPPPAGFSSARAFVFITGRIPRGRAKAPEAAIPRPDVEPADLRALLARSEELIGQVDKADSKQWWRHFALGVMDRDQTLRFVGIHNRHHLRIIADIRAASGG